MIWIKELAHTHTAGPANLVLVTGSNAAAGGADGLAGIQLAQPFLFNVVRKNNVRVIAEIEVVANRDAGGAQGRGFLEETDRIHDDTIADDRAHVGTEDSGGEKGELVGFAVPNNGVAGVGAAVIANHNVMFGSD